MVGFIFFDVATRLVAISQRKKVEEVSDRRDERSYVGPGRSVEHLVYPFGFLAAADHSHFAKDDLRPTRGVEFGRFGMVLAPILQ